MKIDELVVVSDGSVDRTVERAMYFMGRIPGLRIEVMGINCGKWAAIHRGMEVAKNDWILLLDADGSASVDELQILEGLPEFPLWGKREDVVGKSPLRKVLSGGYAVFVGFCYFLVMGRDPWMSDMQCPWKLFRKSWVNRALIVERFAGDVELALGLSKVGADFSVKFVHKAGSKVPWTSMFVMVGETRRVISRARRLCKIGQDVSIEVPKHL